MTQETPQKISTQEFMRVANMLEGCEPIFAKLWQFGVPVWDYTIPTAAVSCLKGSNKIRFHFNPDFWNKLCDYDRAFVIAHELVHVLSNHLSRAAGWNQQIGNLALDVACNNILYKNFGMPPTTVEGFDIHALRANMPDVDIEDDQSAEYYYNLIMAQRKEDIEYVAIDAHEAFDMAGNSSEDIKKLAERLQVKEEDIKKAIEKAAGKEPVQELKNKIAGTGTGNMFKRIVYPPKPKRVWGDVIRKRLIKTMEKYREEDQWLRKPRRVTCWENHGLHMPALMDTDYRVFDKLPVWLFQDTSGSCVHLTERFFSAAKTIPKKQFSVTPHCFDTEVYPTSLETGEIFGGGGTSFSCIEEYIQKRIKEDKVPYPAAVFIVTDGAGDEVQPEYPDRWHWFLSEDNKCYIPSQSPTFMLDTFED